MALQEAKGSKLHPSVDLLFRHTDGPAGQSGSSLLTNIYSRLPLLNVYTVPLEPVLFLLFNE